MYREMAQQLRAIGAFREDPIHSTEQLSNACNSNSRASGLFWPLQAAGMHVLHMHVCTGRQNTHACIYVGKTFILIKISINKPLRVDKNRTVREIGT